jgi:hypothetical protein
LQEQMRTSSLLLLVAFLMIVATSRAQTWTDLDDGILASRSIIVERSALTLQYSRDCAKRLVKTRDRHYMMELRLFQSQKAAWYGLGKPGTDVTYDQWARLYADDPNRLGPFARVLMIESDAVLLYVGSDGATTTEVVAGRNPLDNEQPKFSIVDVRLVPCGTPECESHRQLISPIFFVRSNSVLSESLGESITRTLAQRAHVDLVNVVVRNDPWFVADLAFPTTPVGVITAPPTRSALRMSQSLVCESESQKGLTCTLDGPR